MIEGPFCTHSTVRLTPHIYQDGSRTDCWRCECGQAFLPIVAPEPVPGPWTGTWCPLCGPGLPCDDDGCCSACGATAVGEGAEQALALRAGVDPSHPAAIRLLAVALSDCVQALRAADWYAPGTAAEAQAAIQRSEALLAEAN